MTILLTHLRYEEWPGAAIRERLDVVCLTADDASGERSDKGSISASQRCNGALLHLQLGQLRWLSETGGEKGE